MSDLKNLLRDNKGRTAEERAALREIERELNEAAKANWDDLEWHKEFAAILTESILEGFTLETFFDQIIDVETVGYDDRVYIDEMTGLKVFYTAKGGHIEASALVSETIALPRDTMAFHVFEFEDELLSGFAKQTSELRNLAVRRLEWGTTNAVKNLAQAAIPNGSPYYVSGVGVSQAALNQAIREVQDESKTDGVAIFGRSTMVDQIMDFPGFADEALEEIRNRGRLGRYRGASVIQARNWQDEDGASHIPANEMWVMSRDFGKFAFYGDIKTKEYIEQDNWYWHYIGRRDFGGVVHRPERARRVIDTSITP
jgi:hypothetical protein